MNNITLNGLDDIKQFNRERDEAFLSLDEQKIRDHQIKWHGMALPEDKQVFWGAVHKAITGAKSLPIEFRRKSKSYLTERNLSSFDDGDL